MVIYELTDHGRIVLDAIEFEVAAA
jgi:hypothetical protein